MCYMLIQLDGWYIRPFGYVSNQKVCIQKRHTEQTHSNNGGCQLINILRLVTIEACGFESCN
jgi:hypothetical protein